MKNLHRFIHDILWIMLQVHLQEVGMLNIPADHVKVKGLRYLVRPLNESHGPHIK